MIKVHKLKTLKLVQVFFICLPINKYHRQNLNKGLLNMKHKR